MAGFFVLAANKPITIALSNTNGACFPLSEVSIVSNEFFIHGAGDERIYVHHKTAAATSNKQRPILLMIHGGTYPSLSYDIALGGVSWMDFIVRHGYDVYTFDLPGYGRSSRPPSMYVLNTDNPPCMNFSQAYEILQRVIDNILSTQQQSQLSLLGWCAGATLAAMYASLHSERVKDLVLYGVKWHSTELKKYAPLFDGAYRTIERMDVLENWRRPIPADKKFEIVPKEFSKEWSITTFKTGPWGNKHTLRVPNGLSMDTINIFGADEFAPPYDPSRIKARVLFITGEWDRDSPPPMSEKLLSLLTNAKSTQMVLIPEGTHKLFLEKNRTQLFQSVQDFLEPAP